MDLTQTIPDLNQNINSHKDSTEGEAAEPGRKTSRPFVIGGEVKACGELSPTVGGLPTDSMGPPPAVEIASKQCLCC